MSAGRRRPEALLRLRYVEHDGAGATTALRAVLGTGTVAADGPAFEWRQDSLVDDGVTVSAVEIDGGARVTIGRSPELVVVAVRRGTLSLRVRDRRLSLAEGDLGLVPLGAAASIQAGSVLAELVILPPTPLARLLGVRTTELQLTAPLLQPREPALAAYFDRVCRLLTARTFEDDAVYQRDLVRATAIDLLAATVVEAFELSNRTERIQTRSVGTIRRATSFMREHLKEPISIPEVAEAAGVSVRGLQVVFRSELETTPLMHLRQLRLDAARDELRARRGTGITVAEIAGSYGYSNPGRFSTHYRDAFAESPAEEIQRVADARESAGEGVAVAASPEDPSER